VLSNFRNCFSILLPILSYLFHQLDYVRYTFFTFFVVKLYIFLINESAKVDDSYICFAKIFLVIDKAQ